MKAFYFENMMVHQEGEWKRKKIVFTKNLFLPARSLDWMPNRKIQVNVFKMSPGKVYVDIEFPLNQKSLQDHHVRRYLYQGTSLVISAIDLRPHMDWKRDFHNYSDELSGIAIDYLVVPKVNIKYLTPDMIRYFGLQHVPFILVYAEHPRDLKDIQWGWLNQMQTLVRIPIGCMEHPLSKFMMQELNHFSFQVLPEMISTNPLSKDTLNQTGISRKKGEINLYRDTDFNLYVNRNQKREYCRKVQAPYISVIRGNVVKLNQTIYDQKGFGEFCNHTIQPRLKQRF
ncbi:hypothetical protein SAMN05421676_110100 [Salinibacillus kushneri]|uniref:Uncharacterized protein n=1 Tax=Salinibacillus kushneri TaxID=237682 RepID=A0A1I0I3F9_9BACI|nr:hypothetical protein [Salinibacillus kushneri]SET90361.1 hypothetical protein SAMN05421676_110100 [Salinibacillus kushneri]